MKANLAAMWLAVSHGAYSYHNHEFHALVLFFFSFMIVPQSLFFGPPVTLAGPEEAI